MDLVYVVRHDEHNESLRYSLRSAAANLPHARVWVAGYTPSWVRGVRSVPVPQPRSRWEGSTANLAAALRERFLTRTFVLMNDDFFVTAPVDEVPALHRGPLREVLSEYVYTHTGYATGMREAFKRLRAEGIDEPLSYELHVPLVVDKANMRELLDSMPNDKLDPTGALAVRAHKRTLYGNRYGIGGERLVDVKVHAPAAPLPAPPWASTSPASFSGKAGRALREMFPDPCRYER